MTNHETENFPIAPRLHTYIYLRKDVNESTIVIWWAAQRPQHPQPITGESVALGGQLGAVDGYLVEAVETIM